MIVSVKCQQALCKYCDIPAAEAQSRYNQLITEEKTAICDAFDDAASGKSDHNRAKAAIEKIWHESGVRRAKESGTTTVIEPPKEVEKV